MSKSADFPYLPSGFDPEEELLDQLSNRPGNQRCVVGRDELLLVVHEVPKPGVPEREPLIFWRRADETWLDYAGGKGLRRLGDLLDRYAKVIDEKEELIEEADTAAEIFELVRASAPLSRSSRNLMLVALGGLFGMNVDLPDFVQGWFWLIFFGGLCTGGTLVWLVSRKTGENS